MVTAAATHGCASSLQERADTVWGTGLVTPTPFISDGESTCTSLTINRPSRTPLARPGRELSDRPTTLVRSLSIMLSDGLAPNETPRLLNLITDSEYCVRLFGDNSIKARCNKPIFTACINFSTKSISTINCSFSGSKCKQEPPHPKPWALHRLIGF